MAEIVYLRCPGCGKLSQEGNFGIRDGDFEEAPAHQLTAAINTVAGRGRFRWDAVDISRSQVEALRDSLAMQVERLDAILNEEDE